MLKCRQLFKIYVHLRVLRSSVSYKYFIVVAPGGLVENDAVIYRVTGKLLQVCIRYTF